MDKFYHSAGAVEALEKSAAENEEVTDQRLASLTKDKQWHEKFKVKHFQGPPTLRLVQMDSNDKAAEEAVFTIQGVLSAKNLPPMMEKTRTSSQACYLHQGVTLVGFRTAMFKSAIFATQEIYGLFDQNIEDTLLETWALTASPTAHGRALEASNRYLTSKRDAPEMQPVPILPLVDPHGILEKLKKDGFFMEKKTKWTIISIEAVNPQIFQVGDIIEAQVLFIVVPLKDDKHKMIVILHSITLLDTCFSQEALKNRMCEPEPIQKVTLKGWVGYGEYVDGEEEPEVEQMQVDKHVVQCQKTD